MSERPQPHAVAALPVITLNRGDHAKYDAIRKAIDGHALAALQEMHSVQGILDQLERDGLEVWRGDREDSESNPVVWDPELFRVAKVDRFSYPLLPAARRAGTRNMAKTLNLVRGAHIASRRNVAFGSAHNIHRQWMPGRGKPAEQFVHNLHDAADRFRCATIVGADWNAKPTGKSLHPIRSAPGWHLDQLNDPVTTHGRGWSPDGFAYVDRDADPDVLSFIGHRAQHVPGTDHEALSAKFGLTVREH